MTETPERLGPNPDERGTRFAVFSSIAQRVEVCLFDGSGAECARHDLARGDDGIWSAHLAGCAPGQRRRLPLP